MKDKGRNGSVGSNLTKSGYLERLEEREKHLALKAQSTFGIMGGGLLFIIFGFRYFYTVGGPDWLWAALCLLGTALMLIGFIYPAALRHVVIFYQKLGNLIGEFIFKIFLILVYLLFITPAGVLLRRRRGSAPFFTWIGEAPVAEEGWTPKIINIDAEEVSRTGKSRNMLIQPFHIIGFFIRYKHFFLLPALLILISVGLLMFFVASSTLAPLIYTLF